ncbi:MAG: matrixin family metalloprotease [Pyrinomonadaceae bacterium]|nr:matrixin family metalloprotease [Pyrinomonadaceae bacterium]
MGSITRSITALFQGAPSIAERLARIQGPCRGGGGNRNIKVRIFDQHQFINDMATPAEVVNDLQTFLNGLDTTPGLDPPIATGLAPYNFTVNYETITPSRAQIDSFDVNDFPIYFLTTTGLFKSSTDSVLDLLVANRIPELTFVGRRQDALAQPVLGPVRTYTIIKDDWEDKPSVLGFGIPGVYFVPNSQTRCRKLGIIKMQGSMIENLPFPKRRAKIVSILRHELGHMFGLTHENNTLMDPNYDVNGTFTQYTNDQLWVVVRALDLLTS